jgi:hypothetical protein
MVDAVSAVAFWPKVVSSVRLPHVAEIHARALCAVWQLAEGTVDQSTTVGRQWLISQVSALSLTSLGVTLVCAGGRHLRQLYVK